MATNSAMVAQPTEKKQRHASQKARRITADVIVYIILTVMAIAWIMPIVWVVLQSFTGEYVGSRSRWFPAIWDFQVVDGGGVIMPDGSMRTFNYTLGFFGNYRLLFTNQQYSTNNVIEKSFYNFFGYVNDAGQFMPGGFINTLLIAIFVAVFSTLLTLMTSYVSRGYASKAVP